MSWWSRSRKKGAVGVERNVGGQRVSLQRSREDNRIKGFFLIGDARQHLDSGIAEPVARARRLAGPAPDRLVESLDLRDIRLVPPPFHRPPADTCRFGHGQDALQLEQRAADGHILDEAEPHDLLQAVRLILATHEIDENVRPIGSRVRQRSGIIDRTERQQIARPCAAMLAKLALKSGLQRIAINVVRSQKIPSLAEFLDQRIGDRVGFHRGRLADAEDIPAAMAARDFVGVSAGHDVELALLGRHPRHRERDRRVDVAEDEIDLIAVDQLLGFRDADRDVVRGIFDQELHLAAENAAALIDLIEREPGTIDFGCGELRIDAAERLDHPYFHRFFGAGPDREGRGDAGGTPCQARLEEGPPSDGPSRRWLHPPHDFPPGRRHRSKHETDRAIYFMTLPRILPGRQ